MDKFISMKEEQLQSGLSITTPDDRSLRVRAENLLKEALVNIVDSRTLTDVKSTTSSMPPEDAASITQQSSTKGTGNEPEEPSVNSTNDTSSNDRKGSQGSESIE